MFGNGGPWLSFKGDAALSQKYLQALANWFLVLQRPATPAPVDPTGFSVDDPTGSFDSFGTADPKSDRGFVFRVIRRPSSKFDFVSIGRNDGNDIVLPDESVSRFHAYLRETPRGLVVVDAGSANGTFACGDRLAPKAAPLPLTSGDAVRFGLVEGVAVDVEGLLALLR